VKKTKNKILAGLCLIIAGVSFLIFINGYNISLPAVSIAGIFKELEDELAPGKSCTIKDEEGTVITKISRYIHTGDEVITAEGRHYRVQQIKGNTAQARFIGMDEKLLAYSDFYARMEMPAVAVVRNTRSVGIYHTHSDESYVPSDGTESIPFHGGIFQVGDAYTNTLSRDGAKVFYDKTPHDPHDNNAYYRSRRTAARLMKSNPIALFDVHRDGIDDPGFYQRSVSNQDVAQMRLVVGRENPRMSANLDFARRMMAYANKMYWPITKEIFIGKGNYNQDLLPTALLIEAGTYTNKKEEAMRGISLLADAVPVVLGITGPPVRPGAPEYSKPVTDPTARQPGSWTALAWIAGLTLLAGGAFLLISAGGWREAKSRLAHFFGREFADILGSRWKRK
jgi:stage II sporulation protein P